MIASEFNRLQPELTHYSLTLHMNMHSLIAVEAIKEEYVRAGNIFDRGHRAGVYSTRHRPRQRTQRGPVNNGLKLKWHQQEGGRDLTSFLISGIIEL